MNTQKSEIECKKINCRHRPFYVRYLPDGQRLLCIKVKHHGEPHVLKLSWDDIKEIFGK